MLTLVCRNRFGCLSYRLVWCSWATLPPIHYNFGRRSPCLPPSLSHLQYLERQMWVIYRLWISSRRLLWRPLCKFWKSHLFFYSLRDLIARRLGSAEDWWTRTGWLNLEEPFGYWKRYPDSSRPRTSGMAWTFRNLNGGKWVPLGSQGSTRKVRKWIFIESSPHRSSKSRMQYVLSSAFHS